MSKQPNNPAGRLFKIIQDLKKIDPHKSATDAWASVLAIEVSDTSSLLKGIGATLQLGKEITEAIKKQEVNQELYISYIDQVLKVFQGMNLGSGITDTTNKIREEHIVGLRFCDELLSRTVAEKIILEDDLKKIRSDILALIDEVLKSDIDEYLKQYLLDKLDLLLQAVGMYNISGVKPIENAINNAIGSVAINGRIKDNIKDSPLSKKVFNFVVGLYITIQGINNVAQLPESIDKFLPGSKQVVCKIIEDKKAESENIQNIEPNKPSEVGEK